MYFALRYGTAAALAAAAPHALASQGTPPPNTPARLLMPPCPCPPTTHPPTRPTARPQDLRVDGALAAAPSSRSGCTRVDGVAPSPTPQFHTSSQNTTAPYSQPLLLHTHLSTLYPPPRTLTNKHTLTHTNNHTGPARRRGLWQPHHNHRVDDAAPLQGAGGRLKAHDRGHHRHAPLGAPRPLSGQQRGPPPRPEPCTWVPSPRNPPYGQAPERPGARPACPCWGGLCLPPSEQLCRPLRQLPIASLRPRCARFSTRPQSLPHELARPSGAGALPPPRRRQAAGASGSRALSAAGRICTCGGACAA